MTEIEKLEARVELLEDLLVLVADWASDDASGWEPVYKVKDPILDLLKKLDPEEKSE